MNLNAISSYFAAVAAPGLAFVVACRDPKSLLHRGFRCREGVLALEIGFSGFAFQAGSSPELAYWERLKTIPASFLPGIWLIFS
jgi:hypothetical protein